MITNKELANLIFPEVHETVEDLEKRYPERNLKEGAEVTRFAPSPTGFLHTGSLFTALICRKVATQTDGVFYVRLEDTDTKREIQGSGKQLLDQLNIFGIVPDEGYYGDHEEGSYGPYIQSKRAGIYKIVIKSLIEQGKAYPCFCSPEDIDVIRKVQEAKKENPGYYGEYAKCAFLTNDEAAAKIKNGEKYVIRFRSKGNHNNKIKVHDLIRGDFEIAQNDQDIVILKSDGLPTYHFAHACDDHFMRTTTVIRGEEWIASLPIHVELFEQLGWKSPRYAHLPVIMKLDDNGHKRKLSKRLDSEAAVSFFIGDGFPPVSLTMYLMTIANSNFEEWILNNKFEHMEDFIFSFDKMNNEGALFDLGKVLFFAREILGKMNKEEISAKALAYANEYKPELAEIINRDFEYFKSILNIEREKENPRKDYEKFGNMLDVIGFFYDDIFEKEIKEKGYEFQEKFDACTLMEVISNLRDGLNINQDEHSWFANMKEIAEQLGYAPNGKTFKNNPGMYKGTVGDVAELLRVTLTGRRTCPNPYWVMTILGKEKCQKRMDAVISLFKK